MKSLLYNPFECLSEKRLLLFGVSMFFIAIAAAYYFSIRFDGALDMHPVSQNISIETVIIDHFVAITSLVGSLFLMGKIYNAKTRIIDIMVTVLVARIPFLLLTPFNKDHYISKLNSLIVQTGNVGSLVSGDLILFSAFGIFTLLIIIWFFVLLWNGYKTATNAKGVKAVLWFIIGVIVAEIVSKTLLNFTSYGF